MNQGIFRPKEARILFGSKFHKAFVKRLVRIVTVALASVYAKRENARIQPAIGPAVLQPRAHKSQPTLR